MNQRNRFYATLGFIGLLAELFLPSSGFAVTRDEYTKQECATCHITWLDAFRTEDQVEIHKEWKPALIKETLAIVTGDEMCYSCHDGFVRDARHRVWEGKGHSVGKRPSEQITVPPTMPLDQKGEVYCGTCHTPHGVGEQTAELTGSVFLRVENMDSKLCTLCHVVQLEELGRRNHSVNHFAREPLPRSVFELGGRLGSDPRKIICQSCHTPHGAGPLLKPVEDSSLCLMCHGEKYNPGRLFSNIQPLHPNGIVPKQDLSEAPITRFNAQWGKEGRLICSTCHGVHSGLSSSMVRYPDQTTFCQGCHPEADKRVSAGKHNLLKSAPQWRNLDGETPQESGICRACHRAHGWNEAGPPESDSVSVLCLGCHRKGGAAPEKGIGPISHPVDVEAKTLQEGSPLRPLETNGRKKVVCITCHNPHEDRSYAEARSFWGKKKETNQFLREEKKLLCMECHKDHFTVAGSKHDLSRSVKHEDAELKERATQWGPCAVCHRIHRAKQRYQWALEPSPDVGPGSTWCGSCHNPERCARDRPVAPFNHPLGVGSDREVPEILPLVEIDEEGNKKVVACYTCHNPHQWSPDESSSEPSEEGTPLNSFLRIANDAEASLCVACHPDKKSVGETDHDLRKVNDNNDRPITRPSNVCSGCHLAHSHDPNKKLWTEGLFRSGNDIDRACLACHSEKRAAAEKTIFKTHFTGPIAKRISLKDLPLYPSNSEDVKESIACATCHDPHRWSPDYTGTEQGGEEGNMEGSGKDSFLRMPSCGDSLLCLGCHNEKSRVIGTEHDLRILEEELSDDEISSIRQRGVCSPCHIPHNFSLDRLLWSRPVSTGNHIEEQMCFSCHQKGQIAENKIPARYSHTDVLTQPAFEKARVPFHLDNSRNEWTAHSIDRGIQCFICHDAHQWAIEQEDSGPGRNTEGDAGTSFLWKKSYMQICNLCHGGEGLYRYLYFHKWDLTEILIESRE